MKSFAIALGLAAGLTAAAATAEDRAASEGAPVQTVVELFSSQSCSSCPPADVIFAELADRADLLTLAFHVDYWDYIGWKDTFAQPAFTARQEAYALASGERTVFTPQIIMNGTDRMVGSDRVALDQALRDDSMRLPALNIRVRRQGDDLSISAPPFADAQGPMVVLLARYIPEAVVTVEAGENAGRTITYTNVVTSLTPLGAWDGRSALAITAEAPGADPAAVLLQEANGAGPIVAAVRAR